MAKRQTAEFWERHLEGWRQSGLTQVAYCANHGLRPKSFGRWRNKTKETAQTAGSLLTLVPTRLAAPGAGGAVQFHSPGGGRIELPTGSFTLAAAPWQWLMAGVDWQRLDAAPPARWRG